MNVLNKKYILLFLLIALSRIACSQYLMEGFDKNEFEELIRINAVFSESKKNRITIPDPTMSKVLYVSKVLGLDNKWELWLKGEHTAVIGIRGSTTSTESWLANLFAVQIPAQGKLFISDDFVFDYKLAEHPKAAVHAGYVFSSAFLISDILPKIDSLYASGIRDFIITGHSQGGGLAYLIAANLLWRQKNGVLPQDIRFKIYTSASPKIGNLYFSFDYQRVAHEGWSYSVVNTEDWVPRSPFTVQTIADLPVVNPVPFIQESISKQSFFKRIFLNSIFRKITKPPFKSIEAYQKYLGKYVGNKIKADFNAFELPVFSSSNEYVMMGRQIILYPDSAYYDKFNEKLNPENFMLHHSINAYRYLLYNTTVEF